VDNDRVKGGPAVAEIPVQELTDAELKALAHPLRVRMLDALVADGPATASQLADRFGENTGATSYHLRQLARHGFIEEDTERGQGRQRWWKILRRGWSLPSLGSSQDPATRHHASMLLNEINRSRLERLRTWFETFQEWDDTWTSASIDTDGRLTLTSDELAELAADLHAVLARYIEVEQRRDVPPPGAARVDVQLYAFPTRLEPTRAEQP
jgi:DNA-binding transcriptional ArsR family regulator